ncbi:MAG: phosphoglucosamine mutase [Candidatus Thorarchaeota archaeon]|nr:phosphoglucosamine mutase [Candidatus Thorarchaeota archaeon]
MTNREKLFGTNGVRGIINQSITVDLVLDLGKAIGSVLGPGQVAIARDSRMGGKMFTQAVIAGLLSTGCSIIEIGFAPTPTLQFFVPRSGSSAGVVVTASHNPAEFNGIKVIGKNGIEVSRSIEERITDVYYSKNFTVAAWNEIGSVVQDASALRQHIEGIKTHVDTAAIRNRNLTVVIDSANSVGALITPELMRELGCKVISLNSQLDGSFPGRSPEPILENVTELCKTVRSLGADIGVAHDGDADRATFVDESGRVVSGDQSFALIAKSILSKRPGSTLVTPVSSGRLIEDIASSAGARIEWTTVGSVDVSHKLEEIEGDLGGEENGGVFYPPHQSVRDGPMTVAQIVEIMAIEQKPLSQLIDELPEYYTIKTKIPVPTEKMNHIQKALLKLTEGQKRITIDGVKIISNEGWILLRPSGTEPLYRCFVESNSQETATVLSERGRILIQKAIEEA